MGKQLGTFIVGGKVGDMSFYVSRYGPVVRKIGTVSKERYETDPAFEPRRNAASEFGYAGTLTGLVKAGVQQCCPFVAIGTLHNRLTQTLRKAVLQDKANEAGGRRITSENVGLLVGFNWRETSTINSILGVPYNMALYTADGSASLSIGPLVPGRDMKVGEGATHAQITLALVAVDYERKKTYPVCDKSEPIALKGKGAMSIELSCALGDHSGDMLVAGIGIQGFQQVNGQMFELGAVGFEIGAAGMRS